MAYKVQFPPDIKKDSESSSGLSLPRDSGNGGKDTTIPAFDGAVPDITEGGAIAILIDSAIVGPVWFAFDDNFKSGDDIPIFFASEIPHLSKMTKAELRQRYDQKRALGGGWIRDRIENREICWNCGAAWSETMDVKGNAVRVCWACAVTV